MDSFSWSDSLRAAVSSCLPCFRDSETSSQNESLQQRPRAGTEELERLLADGTDTDTEAGETLSLHSNPGERRRQPRPGASYKHITLFGFHLFGRQPIRLPDDDEEEERNRNSLLYRRRRRTRNAETISSATLDSDAAPLDASSIDGLSSAAQQQLAIAAAEEDRLMKEERRRRRKERKELKKVARALAAGSDDFEGFQGSGGSAYRPMPQAFQDSPLPSSDTRDTTDTTDIDAADADLGGELYARRTTPENSNGSDSRSRTSSQALSHDTSQPSNRHSPSRTARRKAEDSRSSGSTLQSPSLPSPVLSPFHDPAVVLAPSPPPAYGFPSTGLSDSPAPGFGRAKSREMGAFLARRGEA